MRTLEAAFAGLIICMFFFIVSCGKEPTAPVEPHIVTRYEVVQVFPTPNAEASPQPKLVCKQHKKHPHKLICQLEE